MRPNPELADLPLRPELVGEEPYGAPQLKVPVCLNVNENPYSPSAAVIADMSLRLTQNLVEVNRYPDREAWRLREKLAAYLGHGLCAENIWPANGSNEVMTQILGAFGGPGRKMLTFSPTYSMYPEYARNTHTEFITAARHADYTLDAELVLSAIAKHQPDVVVITTPNNPTGTITEVGVIHEICENTEAIVVVDEAYQEFAKDSFSALLLLRNFGNLVVLRTMSKAFAFAGGRLGYLAAAPALVDACRIVRLPYHLSAQTQILAEAALDHASEMLRHVAELRVIRDEMFKRLPKLGLEVIPSAANFALFGRFKDRHAIWQGLLDRGVLIRETGPAGYLRVSTGTRAEMEIFYTALTEVLNMNPEAICESAKEE